MAGSAWYPPAVPLRLFVRALSSVAAAGCWRQRGIAGAAPRRTCPSIARAAPLAGGCCQSCPEVEPDAGRLDGTPDPSGLVTAAAQRFRDDRARTSSRVRRLRWTRRVKMPDVGDPS